MRGVAAMLAAGAAFGVAGNAQAQRAFSAAWMAQKNLAQDAAAATGRLPNGQLASTVTNPLAQQQKANAQLQRSIGNLQLAARGIAAQQAAQAAARQAALAGAADVPDGLSEGGLVVDTNSLTAGWANANAPKQGLSDGRTHVTIEQTGARAILSWETFNVGRNTTVDFKQQADWAVLNRVNDPQARPSQIQGRIQADGTVMVVNRNGIVFSGSSQVDTRNLAASALNISDAQFGKGLFSDAQGSAFIPTFANDLSTTASTFAHSAATAGVTVEAGARIATHAPQSVTEGGGYVLLLGRDVRNAGEIATPSGQTVLGAGDAFVIRKGLGTDSNQSSTTRGSVVNPLRSTGSEAGQVVNSGLVQATTGDITLVGKDVRQEGTLVATTSVHTRGTLHLLADKTDAKSQVSLGEGSLSTVLLDASAATALDVQRETLIKDSDKAGDGVVHRRDQSLVQIDSGGNVDFAGNSLTLATSGQVLVDARGRSTVQAGAAIDVSGAVGVVVAMEANNVLINVQGNEQRDAPGNRDSKLLNNSNLWLDRRDLVLVPAGTNGYETDRWYTAGGLLEVGGYLGVTGHGIGEWSAQGGIVQFGGGELVTRLGSTINVSGGTLDVQTGYINQSWLKGADGRLYNASRAPGDLLYTGVYKGFETEHVRWGSAAEESFYSPLIGPTRRLENGYTVGRDAGKLVVATQAAVLEGDVDGATFQGDRQTRGRDAGMDGYQQAQTAIARGAQLVIGSHTPVYDKETGRLRNSPAAIVDEVLIGDMPGGAKPEKGRIQLDAAWLNGLELGALEVYARGAVAVDEAVTVAMGGNIALHATEVAIRADLTARSGSIVLGDMLVHRSQAGGGTWLEEPINPTVPTGRTLQTVVAEGVTLDARGVWSNLQQDPTRIGGLPFVDGGTVAIRSSGSVILEKDSLIDVSSGAAQMADGSLKGGKGGNVDLAAGQYAGSGVLALDGTLRGYGVKGGGQLNIEHGTLVSIGGDLPQAVERLEAGQASTLPLRLSDDYVIGAGQVIPISFSVTISRLFPGQPVPTTVRPMVQESSPVTLQAPWLLPVTVATQGGKYFYAGTTLPAGTVLVTITELSTGYVLPTGVFPNGLPITPYTRSYQGGSVAATSVVVPAGTRIPVGSLWPETVAVQSFLALDTSLFQRGFRDYKVTGQDGLAVVDGAQLSVAMPVLRANPALARELAGGEDPSLVLETWLPPLLQDDPAKARMNLRDGASLSLVAGSLRSEGDALVGKGARVTVDPGETLTLTGNAQITIEGELQAHGGRISVLPGAFGTGVPQGNPSARSLWIGEHAVLDVSGQAYVDVDAQGRRYGQVLGGGVIEVGGRNDLTSQNIGAINSFVVVRKGARLDASGASATLDLPGLGEVFLPSNGGAIALSSGNGLYIDGELRAAAGGAGASGGSLALNLETPLYLGVDRYSLLGAAVSDAVRVPRELVLGQTYGGSGLSADLKVGESHASLAYGKARYGVDAVHAAGFDTLSLYANGLLSFDGNVDLQMGNALYVTASALGLSQAAARDSQVHLSAPYLRLAGSVPRQGDNTIMPNPVFGSKNTSAGNGALGVPQVAEDARLLIDGGLIDVVGELGMGARGTIVHNSGTPLKVERDAFGDVELRSGGDLRLRGAALFSPGDLVMAATQIYGSGTVVVGQRSGIDVWGNTSISFDPVRSLNIERVGDALPPMPYSVFGAMSFFSATVNQGGVLRAPLGSITLGRADGSGYTGQVNLLPGSITSVSANGLAMPYGGTVDGLSYYYDDADVNYQGVGYEPKVLFNAHAVNVQGGAVIDLSGGGELTGAAFQSGRGGSTDARLHPLMQRSSDGRGFVLPGLSTNPVYAIVPGVQAGQAPVAPEKGAGDPAIGRQITIGQGVPGLPAGTYTLLPSTYALLPGAFRVELNGLAASAGAFGTGSAMRNGSWSTSARLGVAQSGAQDVLPTQVVLTPADTLRSYSQYNETSYADFATALAARDGVPRPVLERDAKAVHFNFLSPSQAGSLGDAPALRFDGAVLGTAADGGHGLTAVVWNASRYELLADGAAATSGFDGVSVHAGSLNAIGASRLVIGGQLTSQYTNPQTGSHQTANIINVTGANTRDIVMRAGAELNAAEVFLLNGRIDGGIVLEQGATINTLGRGAASYDASQGYAYSPGRNAMLAVSNGVLNMLAPLGADVDGNGAGSIEIGACAISAGCGGVTRLYSEGTITAATDNRFVLGDAVRYGTRNLVLAVGGINVGTAPALDDAAARGVLRAGLTLNQDVLGRLLLGDSSVGAPALENLVLTARDSVSFFGNVSLSTIDPATGQSALDRLVLGTPAIYGYGGAGDTARIHTDTLVWTGSLDPAGGVVAGGAGTGSGQLTIDAREIEFGFGPGIRVDSVRTHDRVALGFTSVNLNAGERITANHKGMLSVYQSQGPWNDTTKAFNYSGGHLSISTPLMTGHAGSVNRLSAGGDLRVSTPTGATAAAADNAALAGALGAELALDSKAGSLVLDTAVLLPSGKLGLSAQGDVQLADGAQIDLAGRRINFFDTAKYSWGGDVVIESRGGNIAQSENSRIDLSARNNRAGKLTAIALGQAAGTVALAGAIEGGSTGHYDAGGTDVPFAAGAIDVRGQHIADFAGLNQRLSDGGVVGGRSFQLKQGDLIIGSEVKAREVNVSVDGGHLTVNGTIDAGGEQVGSIRLAGKQGVTLTAAAVLDAHASVQRVDSYGQAIDAPNRAVIEIDSGDGRLTLASGARMDLHVAGASRNQGTVTLNAPRIGGARGNDVDIDAAGAIVINGAKAITVNAFITDASAPAGTDVTADGRTYQRIDQAWLNDRHDDSTVFIANALANGSLMNGKLAGLRGYTSQFHLRPGLEIASNAANTDGDLHVDGDIDLSKYRYASVNPATQMTAAYGSGEAGALVMRAAGNLDVFGSLSDGFDGSRLHTTADDNGWVLIKGHQPWGADVVVPRGGLVTLAADTFFQSGKVLNYDLPMQAMSLAANTVLPATATLSAPWSLAAGTVLSGAVFDASGSLLHAAGTVLPLATTLPMGAQLGAGLRLPVGARVAAMTWPRGVALPFPMGAVNDMSDAWNTPNGVQLAQDLTLRKGSLIPSDTVVKLPGGVEMVDLRPRDADGNQGRNWAVAPMLPSGSQSWDVTLVGGAELGAADRLTVARGTKGGVRLSDLHYGLGKEEVPVPGTGTPATYRWAADADVATWELYGLPPGTVVPGELMTPAALQTLFDYGFITESPLELNDWGVGNTASVETPAIPPDITLVSRPAREELFSVLRTGTGDLRIVSGADILTTSLYGVYTAGTPSASLAAAGAPDRHDQARSVIYDQTRLGAKGTSFESLVDGGSQSLYAAWYPEAGGNLLLRAQGEVMGDSIGQRGGQRREEAIGYSVAPLTGSASVGTWLWRQGTGSVETGPDSVPTAWWINFGTYVPSFLDNGEARFEAMPRLVGFTGFGTLGGGNLVLEAGGDAGMLTGRGDWGGVYVNRSQGLNLAVASTGRMASDGGLVLTGGGDLDVRIGGGLNPDPALRSFTGSNTGQAANTAYLRDSQRVDLNGTLVNLRGALRLEAGSVGGIELLYSRQDNKESRVYGLATASSATASGGPVLVPGDAGVRIDARGDLVIANVVDPGRVPQFNGGTPFHADGAQHDGGGFSWFSLWTPSTAVDLLSAGGNLTPTLAWLSNGQGDSRATDGANIYPSIFRAAAASGSLYYGYKPANVDNSITRQHVVLAPSPVDSHFAATGTGQLELLAAGSIYAGGFGISMSGADPTALPSPFNPGFVGDAEAIWYGARKVHNVSNEAVAPSVLLTLGTQGGGGGGGTYPLFSFTPPTASGYVHVGQPPARYYALEGDIVGLRTGSIVYRGIHTGQPGTYATWYDGGGPVAIRAGRDIVNAGTTLGSYDNLGSTYGFEPGALGWVTTINRGDPGAPQKPDNLMTGTGRGNLIVHNSPDDVSVVQAGRDILTSTFYITGPGLLDISAGRNVYMADKAELRSIGPVANVTPGDRGSGASISVTAGVGSHGPEWAAFAARYLDPANQADLRSAFADQPGKALKIYNDGLTLAQWLSREFGYRGDEAGAQAFVATQQAVLDAARQQALASGGTASNRDLAREFKVESGLHLVNWLSDRFGGANGMGLHFDAATMDARAFFAALPKEQQSAFLRNVYYAELKAAGREYNAEDGKRSGSYLRGREAIATLFPTQDVDGKTLHYEGDLTMFSSALYYKQFVSEQAPLRRPERGVNYIREDEWVARGSPGYDVPFYKVLDAGMHTDFGGDISLMVPGGRALVGVDGGFTPGEGSGLLTQGEGDINIYSKGSLLLGQSRIFTTFGGNILAWSAEGDINAGRGSKTTVVYTPQRRVYDSLGNVALSPTTPNTGAGIATLNPIPEVPPGDIDLIAPLGTIDAGEAGIRVSGNVNLAALQVVNAENIQVQGKAVGIPVIASVNVGTLTNASAAASQAAVAAQDVMQRERAAARQALPSVFTVRVLGFGNDAPGAPQSSNGAQGEKLSYNPDSVVQLLGGGVLTAAQQQALTPSERSALAR
ncbi:filamentous hemagglutinin family protein [Variovorax sp. LT2P21]|uniref:filamentous haemagglutinin family protein n=1 Tax=Variovorax sp. LT2P21 TaxID=3443731 RepID=UPI003F461CAE